MAYVCMLVSASRAALAELLLCDDDDDDVEGEPWRALLIHESTLTPPALPRDPSASEPEDESGGVYVSMEVWPMSERRLDGKSTAIFLSLCRSSAA